MTSWFYNGLIVPNNLIDRYFVAKQKTLFSDENTWEPIDNLTCPALIEEFEKVQKGKATPPSSSKKGRAAKRTNSEDDSDEDDSGKQKKVGEE